MHSDKGLQIVLSYNAYSTKKSLKIPKGQSETVYRRRTDNTMAKRKSTKGQTTIDKTYDCIKNTKNSDIPVILETNKLRVPTNYVADRYPSFIHQYL